MGCRCRERTDALRRATAAVVRGDAKAAARELVFTGGTLLQDARTGDLRREAAQRLRQMRGRLRV